MIDRKVRLLAREVLERMHGCPNPDCSACSSNREAIIKLVQAATGEAEPRLFCRRCRGRGQVEKGAVNPWWVTCPECGGDGLAHD